ncbi:transient receptor potential cation channel subfamily a member 1-like [Gigaspora margarita]|uniref:Transient receptor potential cation channel subfamily a member 1-like n=1 Tax=Gigaspora margarita TaxID=4874 RepID=A0A8H4END1_GIGMA|nr:transient receptor potential cation channel subfamily a member 1-like [Gigaspora margarita]
MTSNPDNSYVVSIEENKEILEIVCSPNLKHVAALHENNDISLWSITSQEKSLTNVKTIHIDNIRTKEKRFEISENKYVSIRKIFAISDIKQGSISHDRTNSYNFKIFDFETEQEIKLTFPDWQKEIDFLSFIENGDIIMVNIKYYRAYVFSSKGKDNLTWDCKSMIELQYFSQIYITPKGKLILFNDTIYEITMWDIEILSVKARVLIEWLHTLKHIEISDNEALLVVCAEYKSSKETNLYVCSTETGINLSSLTAKFVIDRFHLIASNKGERLLIHYINISGKYTISLMDPYDLKNPINANKLFENKQIQEQYIIKSDKIIYTNDGKVFIEQLVDDNWVEYLRKELKDTNRITTLSKMPIDLITKIIEESSYDPPHSDEFVGRFLRWGLELDDKSVILTVVDFNYRTNKWNPDDKKRQLDILPSFYADVKNYIIHCEVLENDDLIAITRIGVFIWTYNKLCGVKMHYYWNDWDNRLEEFIFDKSKFKSLLTDRTPGRILPFSSYETIRRNSDIEFGEGKALLFKQFLENNINEVFYLTCYGKNLMRALIKLKDDKWIRLLGKSCIDKCVKDNNFLISKISLLNIIFENFKVLSENHPAFIASALSLLGFVIPFNIVIPNSTSSHLSKYGGYYHLSKTSYFDILTSILWVHWISFQKRFQNKLQNFQNSHPFLNSIVKRVIDFYNVGHSTTVLAIPLPNFVSYPKDYNFWEELLLPKPNPFVYLNNIEKINEEFYRYLNGEALLNFKWNTSWNFVDLVAIIFATATSINWLKNGSAPTWAITFSVLFLEIRFILFFRANKFFGIYLAMIMKTVDKVISFLIIFGLFILALAHSLHLLIGSEPEISQGNSNFIIAEIELLYMLPHQRRKENWFPYVIFYECHVIKLRDHAMDIQKDKWSGYIKPYISKNLSETLLLPVEQPSLKKIEDDIEELRNYQRRLVAI